MSDDKRQWEAVTFVESGYRTSIEELEKMISDARAKMADMPGPWKDFEIVPADDYGSPVFDLQADHGETDEAMAARLLREQEQIIIRAQKKADEERETYERLRKKFEGD